MPLLDHFHPPLQGRRDWRSFFAAWATLLASDLNARLPDGGFAEPNVRFDIEIQQWAPREDWPGDGWTSAPRETIPLTIVSDVVEVAIFSDEGGDEPRRDDRVGLPGA